MIEVFRLIQRNFEGKNQWIVGPMYVLDFEKKEQYYQ